MPRGEPVSYMSRVVASNLGRLRRRARRSQADLAAAMGFTQAYLSHIERGRCEIKEEWVMRWAALLECGVHEFYDEERAVSWGGDPMGLAEFVEKHKNPPQPVEPPPHARPLRLVGGPEGQFYDGDEVADLRDGPEESEGETESLVQSQFKKGLEEIHSREQALLQKHRSTDKAAQRVKRTNARQTRVQKY